MTRRLSFSIRSAQNDRKDRGIVSIFREDLFFLLLLFPFNEQRGGILRKGGMNRRQLEEMGLDEIGLGGLVTITGVWWVAGPRVQVYSVGARWDCS